MVKQPKGGESSPEEGIDFEALAAEQRQFERTLGADRLAAEAAAKGPNETEAEVARYGQLRKEAKDLDSRLYPETAASDLSLAKEKNEKQLAEAAVALERQQGMLKQITDLAAGLSLAPKVKERFDAINAGIVLTQKRIEEGRKNQQSLEAHFGEIQTSLAQNELVTRQIADIEKQLETLMSKGEVADLIMAQAGAENEVRSRFEDRSKRLLTDYRFESYGRKREKQGQEFVGSLAQGLLAKEIARANVDEIQNPAARAQKINQIQSVVNEGILLGKQANPWDRDGQWERTLAHKSQAEQELMWRGYLLAEMVDSAQTSAFSAVRTARTAANGDPEKFTELMSEVVVPIMNKVKAVSSVDNNQPGVEEGDIDARFKTPATNIYFRDGFYKETFGDYADSESNWLVHDLQKEGYVVEAGEPIYKADLKDTPEGRKQVSKERAAYNKEVKAHQKEVNGSRQEKEKQRVERITAIPKEIKQLEQEKKDLEKAPKSWEAYKKAVTDLEQLRARRTNIESAVTKQEGIVAAKQAEFDQAGVLAKRRILGKGAAAKELDAATSSLKNGKANLRAIDIEINKTQEIMAQNQAGYELIQSGRRSDREYGIVREIESLQKELETLGNISYAVPVEIIK
ncbi:MAG: hypothetical protein WCW26_02250 [Candidatus Buchananbacteria bacterium]